MKFIFYAPTHPSSLLQKIVRLIVTVVLVGVLLMFSAVMLVVILIVVAIALVYLWWKTREIRKLMKNVPPRSSNMEDEMFGGEVIEGQVIRRGEIMDRIKR
jgi:ABC-type bacteriocin/lantibiotic exporter with double-glycine peptidase domain